MKLCYVFFNDGTAWEFTAERVQFTDHHTFFYDFGPVTFHGSDLSVSIHAFDGMEKDNNILAVPRELAIVAVGDAIEEEEEHADTSP